MVVVPGETVTEVPVSDPGIHEYVVAPDAVMVVEFPVQMVDCDAETLTVGVGFTVMSCVAVLEHPALVPVTV